MYLMFASWTFDARLLTLIILGTVPWTNSIMKTPFFLTLILVNNNMVPISLSTILVLCLFSCFRQYCMLLLVDNMNNGNSVDKFIIIVVCCIVDRCAWLRETLQERANLKILYEYMLYRYHNTLTRYICPWLRTKCDSRILLTKEPKSLPKVLSDDAK